MKYENTFKAIDQILWKEQGCGSELDYLEQKSWMLFLKYLDDLETEREDEAELEGKTYKRLVSGFYRWSQWATPKKKDPQTGKMVLDTVNAMINDVFPMCKTSLSNSDIISLATQMFNFEIEATTGFPFEHIEKNVYVGSKKLDAVVPVTLEQNVKELHEFLFNEKDYACSGTVVEYSNDIAALSGLTEKSRDVAVKNSVIAESGGEADVVK